MSSRIEQIIDEIEEYVDGCKFAALSNKNILVNKEELEELIAELRSKTPEEIKRYQKIISNKEAIMADAQSRAEDIITQAREQAAILVSEHQIYQEACVAAQHVIDDANEQAQNILDEATVESNNVRTSAIAYTDELLMNIQGILTNSVDTTRARYENLLSNLQAYLNIVTENRQQLMPQEEPAEEPVASAVEEAPAQEAPAAEEAVEIPAIPVEEAAADGDDDLEEIDLDEDDQ